MGAINIKHTGSGSDVTLSSDGTDLLLDGTAIGGLPELYAENYDGTSTKPTATGTNAVAIGVNATATQDNNISIGINSDATGVLSSSFGIAADSAGGYSTALGYAAGTSSLGSYSLAAGANAQTAGTNAIALGNSYASGNTGFAAAIGNNTSTYGATGTNSVAIGQSAKATSSWSFAYGRNSQSTSSYSVVLGGYLATASKDYAYAFGHRANADIIGKYAYGVFTSADVGTSQGGYYVLALNTTDATASPLVTNGGTNAGSTTNQIILPNNSAYSFSGTIIARQDAASGSNYASWEIKGALLRDANAASTVLGNGISNKLYATAGASAWAIALSADTTNGGLKIEVTGAAATNIRWVATVHTSEVTY